MTAYRSARRRPPAIGRTVANRYPGPCSICGEHLAAGDGIAVYRSDGWKVSHRPAEWCGSPVSGRWVGGCPKPTEASGNAALDALRSNVARCIADGAPVIVNVAPNRPDGTTWHAPDLDLMLGY